jgi:hypothetical protein
LLRLSFGFVVIFPANFSQRDHQAHQRQRPKQSDRVMQAITGSVGFDIKKTSGGERNARKEKRNGSVKG